MKTRSISWLLVFGALSINCFNDPLAPVMPVWDATLTFPLADKLFTIAEWVSKDTALLKTGAGNLVSYAQSTPVRPTYVGDLLTLSPRDTSLRVRFGVFTVAAPPPVQMPITVPSIPAGGTVPIPESTIDAPDVSTVIPTFAEVTLHSGTISLTVQNNLPVRMDLLRPLQLVDSRGRLVTTFVFTPDTIAPRQSRTATGDLAGKSFSSNLTLTPLRFHTPGSGGALVQIPQNNLLVATLACSDLKARRAVLANVPAQRLVDNDTTSLRLDDSTLVEEILVRTGRMNFLFTNRIALDLVLKFRFTDVQRRIGGRFVSYEDSLSLAAHGSGQYTLDLSDTRIKAPEGTLLTSLSAIATVVLPASSAQPVTVNDTDKVEIAVTRLNQIVADSAIAVIRPTWVNVNTIVGLDLGRLPPKFRGHLNVPAASMGLALLSGIGFPGDLYVSLGARKSAAGDSVFLHVPASQRRIRQGSNDIVFDPAQGGQFLTQISGKLPDSLRVTGRILINPPDVYNPTVGGVGAIGRGCSVSGAMNLTVPLNLGISDGFYADTLAIGDSTGDGRSDFTLDKSRINDVNNGRMYIEVENGLPVQMHVFLNLLNNAKQNLLQVPQGGQPIAIAAANVDGEGNVVGPVSRTTVIEMNQGEVRQFNPAEWFAYSVVLNTTAGSPSVRFKTSDYFKVRVWTTLSYRIKN